jgi:hypothetical protein
VHCVRYCTSTVQNAQSTKYKIYRGCLGRLFRWVLHPLLMDCKTQNDVVHGDIKRWLPVINHFVIKMCICLACFTLTKVGLLYCERILSNCCVVHSSVLSFNTTLNIILRQLHPVQSFISCFCVIRSIDTCSSLFSSSKIFANQIMCYLPVCFVCCAGRATITFYLTSLTTAGDCGRGHPTVFEVQYNNIM